MPLPWVIIEKTLPQVLLRMQIANTLQPEVDFYRRRMKAVDFSLEGFVVSPTRLVGVAKAVLDGRIGVKVGNTGPNFGASYTRGPERRFTLGESKVQPDDSWRATIVHEAVHAAFDLASESPAVDLDEAAAYLAETVFFRAGGLRRSVKGSAEVVAIFTAANDSVERLSLHTKPGARLRRADVQGLLDTLNAHPGYGH